MAQAVLGGIGGLIGGGIGQAVGMALGRIVDGGIVASLSPARQRGPRLEALKVQSTAEGAPMAWAMGRARVTGQVIWAARFLEKRNERGGSKGGPRTVDYAYSLSFAVAVCEGPIDGIGRVWADGRPLDLSGVTMRVHRGTADQTPDPLIEAVEGAAPAYRGTAYVVFEDLPLGPFGNRLPQLSFEVFRRPRGIAARLEDRLEGVCLIPGAGEFVLATEPVFRREGLTRSRVENVNNAEGRADFLVSLDQLQAQAPKLKRVSLVIGWFGDDLRAGHCRIRPGVERLDRPTRPLNWSVAGLARHQAHVVSRADGAPAYGGTPSDRTVRAAVAELKRRGLEVTLYPFVFMDIPAGNGKPDPYGGTEQAAYPWRGRVKGADGAGAAAEIEAMFGAADGWGLRRMALHYARMAAETGADGLLIGSEMRGLTWTRDADGGHPAVARFRALAAECRAVVGPGVKLSYAADWSEYFGHHVGGDVTFHLDPLWADPNIDYVGIDWYPPLGDWRSGEGGVDALAFDGPADPAYLADQVAGGENFDWYYADAADRAAQARTPITDGAHGEHWLFRPKDLKGWWSNPHHDRPGGVRRATPTAWVPGMKPIRLTEFGCAAVDRGGNAPNLFQDPKSAETALPPFSTGARDDVMQRRALEAVLAHYAEPANNPVSAVYGGRMLEGADAWCWDARPYPAFPARAEVWADAGAWRTGHWLNGRLSGEAADLVAAVIRRAGVAEDGFTVGPVKGAVAGYVIDRPMRVRDALEPLAAALNLTVAERGGKIAVGVGDEPVMLSREALALPEDGAPVRAERVLEPPPETARVRFIDEAADYQTGAVTAHGSVSTGGGSVDLDLPVACGAGLARAAARRRVDAEAGVERLTVALGPLEALRLEPGDAATVEGEPGVWRVARLRLDERPEAELERIAADGLEDEAPDWRPGEGPAVIGEPFVRVLDLPPLFGSEDDARPLAAVAADPWRPMRVHAGTGPATLTARGLAETPATVGVLTAPLRPGVTGRWDEANALIVRLEGRAPESRGAAGVLAGGSAAAVETVMGWEVIQYRRATLVGPETWRLDGLLRGQQGTEDACAAGAASGAVAVLLDEAVTRLAFDAAEVGTPRVVRAAPDGAPPSDPGMGGAGTTETEFVWRHRHARPWRPAHLRVRAEGAGLRIGWTPRVRSGGDRWDGEPVEVDPRRFRLRALDGTVERRVWQVEGVEALYPADWLATDFPAGPGATARVAVAQWGEGYGWGAEALVSLLAAEA